MRIFYRRTYLLIALLPLLAGCGVSRSEWPDWLSDILQGPAPTVQPPATPVLRPTPTLAAVPQGGEPGEQPGAETTAPPAVVTPAQPTSPVPAETPGTEELGPFTGTFAGTVFGDRESSAPLELTLVQRGRQIEGAAVLGDGLIVSAGGVCGSFPIPAITLNASDELDQANERHLSTTTNVAVSGFEIPVVLEATLGPDGRTVVAEATMYPPALCRNNPSVTATLLRIEE